MRVINIWLPKRWRSGSRYAPGWTPLCIPAGDIALPFRVLSGGIDVLKVVSRESEGARVSVKLSGNRSGIITVTPESASGSAHAVLSNGTREAAFRLAFHTYQLAVSGAPPACHYRTFPARNLMENGYIYAIKTQRGHD